MRVLWPPSSFLYINLASTPELELHSCCTILVTQTLPKKYLSFVSQRPLVFTQVKKTSIIISQCLLQISSSFLRCMYLPTKLVITICLVLCAGVPSIVYASFILDSNWDYCHSSRGGSLLAYFRCHDQNITMA